MSGTKYPPSGALFQNKQKKSEKSPDYDGEMGFDEDTVRHLVNEIKAGREPKCRLAGWKRVSGKGTSFLSLKASPPQQQEAPARRPAPTMDDDQIPF